MKNVLKTSCLFAASIIGAGFASGKEIALYFGSQTPFSACVSGIMLGLSAGIFMLVGRSELRIDNKFFSALLTFVSLAIQATMLAACESLGRSLLGIPFFGAISGALSIAIVSFGTENMKLFDSLVVVMIVVLTLCVFFKSEISLKGNFNFSSPLLYAGLNVLLGGLVLTSEGKNKSNRQILAVSVTSAIVMGGLLFVMQCLVKGSTAEMPFLLAAQNVGLGFVSPIIVYVSVFSTLLTSAETADVYALKFLSLPLDEHKNKRAKPFRLFVSFFISYLFSFLGFDYLVNNVYPAVSYLGILYLLYLLPTLFLKTKNKVRVLRGRKKSLEAVELKNAK